MFVYPFINMFGNVIANMRANVFVNMLASMFGGESPGGGAMDTRFVSMFGNVSRKRYNT